MADRPTTRPPFTSEPPHDASERLYKIERTPAIGKIIRTILTDQLTGCGTHYVDRRTTPCLDATCEYCKAGNGRRWHGYLQTGHPVTMHQTILELPSLACITISEWNKTNGSLRGMIITAYRFPARTNGRVFVEISRPRQAPPPMPPRLDVQSILERIWGIPQEGSGMTKSQIATEHKKHSTPPDKIPTRIGASIDPRYTPLPDVTTPLAQHAALDTTSTNGTPTKHASGGTP